jgi:hypothetical protein
MKELGPDKDVLLALISRWKDEASRSGRDIRRICVTYEERRDDPVGARRAARIVLGVKPARSFGGTRWVADCWNNRLPKVILRIKFADG